MAMDDFYDMEEGFGAPGILHDRVMYHESRGRDDAVSPVGAVGRMQTMRDTLRDPGFGVRPAQSDDPDEWARVGHDYLDAMYSRYDGDIDATLAAYNWGPGRADDWVARGKPWEELPRETQDYISRIKGDLGNMPEKKLERSPIDDIDAEFFGQDFLAEPSKGGEVPDLDAIDAEFFAQSPAMAAPAAPQGEQDGNFSTGFQDTFRQLPELGWGLAAIGAATMEKVVGHGGLATRLKEGAVENMQEWQQKIAAEHQENHEWDKAWEKTKQGDFDALTDFLGYGLGYAVGQGLQLLGTAGVGALAGKVAGKAAVSQLAGGMVAKEAAKIAGTEAGKELAEDVIQREAVKAVAGKLGAQAGLAGMAFGMEGGEIGGDLAAQSVEEGRELTGSELMKGLGATLAAGSLEYAADALGLGAAGGLLKGGGRLGQATLGLGAGAAVEGGTEFGQTLIEEYGKGNDPFSEESIRGATNAAALGAVGGGAFGGVAGAMTRPNEVEQPGPVGEQSPPQQSPEEAPAPAPGLGPQPAPVTDEEVVSTVMGQETADDAIAAAQAMADAPVGMEQPQEQIDSAANPVSGEMVKMPDGSIWSKADAENAMGGDPLSMGAVPYQLGQEEAEAALAAQQPQFSDEQLAAQQEVAKAREKFANEYVKQSLGEGYTAAQEEFAYSQDPDNTVLTRAKQEALSQWDGGNRILPLDAQKQAEEAAKGTQVADPLQDSTVGNPMVAPSLAEPTVPSAMTQALADAGHPAAIDEVARTADADRGFAEMEAFRQQELAQGQQEADQTLAQILKPEERPQYRQKMLEIGLDEETADSLLDDFEGRVPTEAERLAAQRPKKPLTEITVPVTAFDEDGNEAVYEEKADVALKDTDDRLDIATRLIRCLNS